MRIYKPRGLNIDESYACSRTAVRKCFDKQDISISWGNPEKYAGFHRRGQEMQNGAVVASIQMKRRQPIPRFPNPNRRPMPMVWEGRLNFYIITDPAYDAQQKQNFEENCLPRLREWFDTHIAPEYPEGIEEMVVFWHNASFAFQERRNQK